MVLSAVMLSIVAGGALAAGADGPGWLFAGRLIMGLASGERSALVSRGSRSCPPAARGRGARRGCAAGGGAMTLGFALGPLVAGALAQWGPMPPSLPYLPQLALAAGALALAARTPETVLRDTARRAPGGPWRQLRAGGLTEPRFLWVVLPLAPWVFGSVAVAMVYMPGLVAGRVSGMAVAFAAAGALCTALAGVLVRPVETRARLAREPQVQGQRRDRGCDSPWPWLTAGPRWRRARPSRRWGGRRHRGHRRRWR